MCDVDITELMKSPGVVAAITGIMTLLGGCLVAFLQRGHNKEIERDRFRHDIAAETARVRLEVHVNLANKVAAAYRSVRNERGSDGEPLNDAKNYYYDNRFFFSRVLGIAFRKISDSLATEHPNRDILETNLNDFFICVRNDLLLTELSESAERAVQT